MLLWPSGKLGSFLLSTASAVVDQEKLGQWWWPVGLPVLKGVNREGKVGNEMGGESHATEQSGREGVPRAEWWESLSDKAT